MKLGAWFLLQEGEAIFLSWAQRLERAPGPSVASPSVQSSWHPGSCAGHPSWCAGSLRLLATTPSPPTHTHSSPVRVEETPCPHSKPPQAWKHFPCPLGICQLSFAINSAKTWLLRTSELIYKALPESLLGAGLWRYHNGPPQKAL